MPPGMLALDGQLTEPGLKGQLAMLIGSPTGLTTRIVLSPHSGSGLEAHSEGRRSGRGAQLFLHGTIQDVHRRVLQSLLHLSLSDRVSLRICRRIV